MPCCGDLRAERRPVHLAAARDFDRHAALLLEEVERVLREQAAVPLRALVARSRCRARRRGRCGLVGVVGDRFHASSLNSTALRRGEGVAAEVERVREAHHAEADRAVAAVRRSRRLGRVEVDVDDVVERADGDADRLAELLRDRCAPSGVRCVSRMTEPRLQTAVSSLDVLSVISVQRFERVDDADVVLRGADVAGVLEGDPRVAGLEEHREHFLPELERRDLLAVDLALSASCSYST